MTKPKPTGQYAPEDCPMHGQALPGSTCMVCGRVAPPLSTPPKTFSRQDALST